MKTNPTEVTLNNQEVSESASSLPKDRQIRHTWLLSVSLLLVILIEIVPVEIDILYDHYLNRKFLTILAFKLMFLTVILSPSLLFKQLNQMSSLKFCRYGRFQFTIVVVSMRLLADLFLIVRSLNS